MIKVAYKVRGRP